MIEAIAILAIGAAILLYAEFIPDDIVEEQAKDKFKKLYGYDYKKR